MKRSSYLANLRKKDQFRHELKYFIHAAGLLELKSRLRLTMDRDIHADKRGNYHVRSLYFDDIYDSAAQTKLAGLEERKKYRLRMYNHNADNIRLECKKKSDAGITKRSLWVSSQAAEALIWSERLPKAELKQPLGREVQAQLTTARLRPVVIVDYLREAYVMPYQDIRITLDKRLAVGLNTVGFFDRSLPSMPVLEPGFHILEIKFNDFLPSYYRDLLQGIPAQRSAASKFLLCRNWTR